MIFFSLLVLWMLFVWNQVNAQTCTVNSDRYSNGWTQIDVCPVPYLVLKPWVTQPTLNITGLLFWDQYPDLFDNDTLQNEQTCLGTISSDTKSQTTIQQCLDTRSTHYTDNNCPYGIARWNGQCTYKSLTYSQDSTWSCVKAVRARKLDLIIAAGYCAFTDQIEKDKLQTQLKNEANKIKPKKPLNKPKLPEVDKWDPVDLEYWEFTYGDTLISNVAPWANNEFSVSYKNQLVYENSVWYNFEHSWNKYVAEWDDGISYFDWELNRYVFVDNYSKSLNAKIENNWAYVITFDADSSKMYFQDINWDGTYKIVKQEFSNWLSYNVSYNELWKINTVSDTLGRITMFNYNLEYWRLEQVTDPYGRAVLFDYYMWITSDWLTWDLKSITVFHDGEYKTTSFAYDTSVTYVYDKKWKIIDVIVDHVKSHNMKRMVDAKWVVYVTNTYDANDRVTTQTYGNHSLSYSYQLNWNTVVWNTVTNRKWQVTNYAFDSNGNTTSFTAWWITYRYNYDADSQMLAEILPNGNTSQYMYDSKWYVTNITRSSPLGETINQSYTYTTDWKIATSSSPDGIMTTYTYSPGWLVLSQSAKPLDNSKSSIGVNYTYNYHNLIDTVSLPDWQRIKYTYNENDQIIKVERNWAKWETVINLINYDQYWNPISMSDGEWNVTQLWYNSRDQVKQVTSPSWIKQYLQYDKTNNLTKSSLLLENWNYAWQTMNYDILDNLTIVDYNINATTNAQVWLWYDPNENTEKTVDPNDVVRHYEYDAFQRATKRYATILSNWEVQKIIYTYICDSVWNVIKTTDPKWHETSIEYNWLGQAVKVTNEQWTYALASYDSKYNLVSTEIFDKDNKLQQKQTYTYDSRWNVVTSTQHDVLLPTRKLTTTTVYDALNRPIEVTDPKWWITNYSYDGLGRVESVEDAMGRLQTNLYNNNDQLIAEIITTAEWKTLSTYYDYDKEWRLVKTTNHVWYTQYFNYNNLHQLISKTDQEWNKITYKYDYLWNLTQEIKNDWKTNIYTTYNYDKNWNLLSLTDGNGNKTVYTYDGLDRQTKKVLPDGTVTNYRYDQNDNLVKWTDPNGNVISNTYDILDRLVDRKIALWKNIWWVTSESYKYDTLGRLVYSNDSQNNELKFEFNGLGSLSKETNNWKSVDYVNNNYNDLLEIIYPSGKKFAYNYDMDNRLVEISESKWQSEWTTTPTIWALKSIILNQYDSATLQKTVYWNTTETNYKYDTLLRLKELQHANFKTPAPMDSINYAFTYDKESNIVQNWQDTFWYDDVYRLTDVQYNNGNLVKRQNWTLTKWSQTSTDYNQRKQERKYDPAGNRKTEFNNVPGIAIKEDITWRSNSAVSQIITDWSQIVQNKSGWWKISNMLSFGNNTATKSKETGKMILVVGSSLQAKWGWGWGWSKWNSKWKTQWEEKTKTNGNGIYNGKWADSWLKKWRDKTAKNNALKWRCSWKASGKGATPPKCKWVSLDNTIIPVYSWYVDGIPNLFTGQKPVVPNDTVTYNANNLNQYTSVEYWTSSINLKYDRNGNMIANEKFKFTYDYTNRLIKAESITSDYLVDTFTYDTLWRRLTKYMDTKSNVWRYIKYVYSNENAIEEERFYNIWEWREQTKEYIYWQWTDDVVKIYIEKQGLRNEQRFYRDNQGSVVAIADEYGKIVESYRYDAFWNLILWYQSNSIKFNLSPSDKNAQTNTANGSKSWITNNRLYTAREYDKELDLYYYRRRIYDARMGRFIQRDPIWYTDDVNLYTYVGNNPVNYTDPWGLSAKNIIPDKTQDFVDKLISAWKQSIALDKKYDRMLINTCKYSLKDCYNPWIRLIIEWEKYYEYYKYAFKKWDYKNTSYAPKNIWSKQLEIWWQIWNYDDPGNFLIWYTLAASDISLFNISSLSYVNSVYDTIKEEIKNVTNVQNLWRLEHISKSFANEFNDQKFIRMWYDYYMRYWLNITAWNVETFINNYK